MGRPYCQRHRMRLPASRRRRAPTAQQVRAARLRLAALSRAQHGGVGTKAGWVPQVPPDLEATREPPPVGGSAVLDRVPLRLRAAVESLPEGVRGGRLGLESGHAVVVILVVLLALAVAALLLGLGRPRVESVGSGVSASVIATGTPATGVVDIRATGCLRSRVGAAGRPRRRSGSHARGGSPTCRRPGARCRRSRRGRARRGRHDRAQSGPARSPTASRCSWVSRHRPAHRQLQLQATAGRSW